MVAVKLLFCNPAVVVVGVANPLDLVLSLPVLEDVGHTMCSLGWRSGDGDSCKMSFVLLSLMMPVIMLPSVSALVAGSFMQVRAQQPGTALRLVGEGESSKLNEN